MPKPSQYIFLLLLSILSLTACENAIDETRTLQVNKEGLDLLNQGKSSQAISKFKQALDVGNPSNETKIAILRNIAICYYENDQIDSSIYFSKQALSLCKKESYEYYINEADIDLLEKRIDRAIKNLKRARRINPEELEVNNVLGLIFIGEYGDEYVEYERALYYNEKAFQVSSGRPTKTVLARNYYYLKRYEEAEKLFTELHEKHPDLLDYQYWVGITKYDNGEIDTATIILEELVRKDSTYADLMWFLYE